MTKQDGALRRALIAALIFLLLLSVYLARPFYLAITHHYFEWQGRWVAIANLLILMSAILLRWSPGWPQAAPRPRLIAILTAVLALFCWAGTYLVMFDYPNTRDEHMVVFDAATFASGRLAQILPEEWQGYGLALAPAYLLESPGHQLLLSDYMPVNAAMRALFGLLLDPALMNPLLAALGFVLTWRLARKLFPDCPAAIWVVVTGYAISSQIAGNAMTTYAMTGHLVFNLLWLTFFLRGGALGHALAMITGVLAIGLHQIIFHPLFAGPFILWLLVERRWRLFLAYSVVYAAGLGFWMSYQHLLMEHLGLAVQKAAGSGASWFFVDRILPLLTRSDPTTFAQMAHNVMRFINWNAAFLLPLTICAFPAVRKRLGIALPLAAGIVLTLVTMTILLPYQGHGWGYRYLHGFIGSFALLCGYGVASLSDADRQAASRLVAIATAVALVFTIPFLMISSRLYLEPFHRLSRMMETQDADFVVADTFGITYSIDQVRNRSDLTNRPLMFSAKDLSDAQMLELCRRGSVATISRTDVRSLGLGLWLTPSNPPFERKVALIEGKPCDVPTKLLSD